MYYYRIGIAGGGFSIPLGGGASIPGSSSQVMVFSRVGTTGASELTSYTGRAMSGMAGVGAGLSAWIESPLGGRVFRSLHEKRFRVKLYDVVAGQNTIDTEVWVYPSSERPVQVLPRTGIRYSGALLSSVDVTVTLYRGVGGLVGGLAGMLARYLCDVEEVDAGFDYALESHQRRAARR